ncbi:hydrolase [Nibricoccus aquaticus]|uniref:Hydrolase n=1 Tax=Nibricoccus aquaticus TaxID=2576891 RepID=A0A290QMG7_9BACT|nr:alpha/beta hydrolase family protein [Nibricoccus aquaticus]ATC65811.1 hydrolase [Nibricoccus aquaticus]
MVFLIKSETRRALRRLIWLSCLLSGLSVAGGSDAPAAGSAYQTSGVTKQMPVFYQTVKARTAYPLSWLSGRFSDFQQWRTTARKEVILRLLAPPADAGAWEPVIVGEEDRGNYVVRKIIFNLTGDSHVLAYMTVPKGKGPFPAVLLLHSHSGKFDIGKEKVIRPWGVPSEKLASAEALVAKEYDGVFIGDALAERGYVCFSTDALNWSDRGGGAYAGQAQLASNLLHLGMSLAGLIAWEDLRAAEFLAAQPEIDPKRVAAVGMSMGAYRAWQVAALSDRISASVSICWMTTVESLMTPPNNQTQSHSAFTTVHPGLLDKLDYSDVASLACPKPMLFFNGRSDDLFPQEGVERAYARMHAIWDSQGAGDQLITKSWDGGHVFTRAMQAEAFDWLDRNLGAQKTP